MRVGKGLAGRRGKEGGEEEEDRGGNECGGGDCCNESRGTVEETR